MDAKIIKKAAQEKLMKKRAGKEPVMSVKNLLLMGGGLTVFGELIKALKGGVKTLSHGAQENPRWKKFIKKYPEFGEGDQAEVNREIFHTIHELSPTVSKNPTMAAQMLHAAREYGLPGLDINAAKTLADLESSRAKSWKYQTEIPTSQAASIAEKGIFQFMQPTR